MPARPAGRGREAVQRWRLRVARDERVADLTERAALGALAAGLLGAGLPIATSGEARPRTRMAFAAPLPKGATADEDPVEIYLSQRLPVATVRARIANGLPAGFRLVDLHDEWVGAPSLASRVSALDYELEVAAPEALAPDTLDRAVRAAGAARPAGAEGEQVRSVILAWTATQGRGTVAVRVVRDAEGRLTRPSDVLASLGLGLRVVGLRRTGVDVSG